MWCIKRVGCSLIWMVFYQRSISSQKCEGHLFRKSCLERKAFSHQMVVPSGGSLTWKYEGRCFRKKVVLKEGGLSPGTPLYTHTCTYTHTHTFTHTCMHACTHTHVHVHSQAHMHAHTDTLAHTHTHHTHVCTHTHIHTPTQMAWCLAGLRVVKMLVISDLRLHQLFSHHGGHTLLMALLNN